MQTVSDDPYIARLCLENDVDIVISSGALTAIVALQASPSASAHLPVIVREMPSVHDGTGAIEALLRRFIGN